jgi:hypothetical protein
MRRSAVYAALVAVVLAGVSAASPVRTTQAVAHARSRHFGGREIDAANDLQRARPDRWKD